MTFQTHFQILRLEDFSAVWDIFQKTFPSKYKDEFRQAWIHRATAYSWALWQKIQEGEVLLGFVITSYQKNLEDSYHIHFLGVNPSVQKGGFGTTLLHKVIQQAAACKKAVSLYPVQNERLIRWYEKEGFSFHGKPTISPFTGDEEFWMVRWQT